MSNVIKRNLYFLCENTVSLQQLLAFLIGKSVITTDQAEEIESGSTDFNKFAKLYLTISKKISIKTTYEYLTQALLTTNQQHIVEELSTSQINFEQSAFFKKLNVPAKALSIVDVSEPNFRINTDAFNFVLDQTGGMPIVVLSINGPSRSGKRFILNSFLRYLERLGGNEIQWHTKGNENLRPHNPCSATFLRNPVGTSVLSYTDEMESTELFQSGGGQDRITVGINLWSKPFFVQTDDGSFVALLLLNVHGLFDKETSYRENAIIFALSSLFSTYMMYNQLGVILEDVLQNIQCFLSLAENVANDYNKDMSTDVLALPSNFLLLLRDLENENYEYGLHSFGSKPPSSTNNYLRDLFSTSQEAPQGSQHPSENQRTCDKLNAFPFKIASYILPHQGLQIKKSKNRISYKSFKEQVLIFMRFIVNTQLRQRRTSQNELVNSTQYAHVLSGIAGICQRAPTYFLKAKSFEELKNINEHMNALQRARQKYLDKLKQFVAIHSDGASQDEFNRANKTALNVIEKEFEHLENYRTDYDVQFLEEKDKMISELYRNAKYKNTQNILAKEIQDAKERHQKALEEAELNVKRKEADLLESQVRCTNAQAKAEEDKGVREAAHHSILAKLEEDAERGRQRRDEEIHQAHLALAASHRALNETLRAEKRRNWGQRVFGLLLLIMIARFIVRYFTL